VNHREGAIATTGEDLVPIDFDRIDRFRPRSAPADS
jgi:hypothetical protein